MSENKSINVLAVGVGGQGIIRFSNLLAMAAFIAGRDVKKSEIHGLSQRGGSVTSHIRWGERVFTPVIMNGEADFILALEELEALRWAHMVKPGGLILVNNFRILPATVITGKAAYPENLRKRLAEYARVQVVDATGIAKSLGNAKASNTVLMGALSQHLDIEEKVWGEVLEKGFTEKIRELNQKAFAAGVSCGA